MVTRRGVAVFAGVFVLLVGFGAAPLAGQDRGVQRQQLENRVRQAFQNRVRQELALTRTEIPRVTEVVRWSEGERRQIARRTRQLNARATAFLRDGGTEAEARQILEERRALQREESELFGEEQDRLLTVLSPNQIVRLYRLRDQLNQQLQRARARRAGNENDP